MLTFSETMAVLLEMRGRYDDGFSSTDRLFIKDTYAFLFGEQIKNSSCSNCYRDAYILIYSKLKKEGIMPKEKKFILLNGVLLHALNGQVFTNANLTDEIAMDALNENANRLDLFAKYPENYKELCDARKTLLAEKASAEPKSNEELQVNIKSLKSALETANSDLANEQKKNEELEAKISALNEEKAVAEGSTKELNDKIAELTTKNEALTSEKEALAEVKESLINDNEELLKQVETLKKALSDAQSAGSESPAKKAAKEQKTGDSAK